jgi:hypothetical protein
VVELQLLVASFDVTFIFHRHILKYIMKIILLLNHRKHSN